MITTISKDNRILIADVQKRILNGQQVRMTVRGRSMRPFIEDGRDKVVLEACSDYRVGDVVLADTREKGYVIHRLTRIDAATGQCELRGDGNLDVEHCTLNDMVAKIVMFYRKANEKPCSVESRKWKIYSWVWMKLLPVRRYLLAFNWRFRKYILRQ